MPNGGLHHCGNCLHFVQRDKFCSLRGIAIELDHWTTCRNFDEPGESIRGPVYAIVCEVKNFAGGYCDIPYFDGHRVQTVQDGTVDTVVRFTDSDGKVHEFPSVTDYLRFYKESGREL